MCDPHAAATHASLAPPPPYQYDRVVPPASTTNYAALPCVQPALTHTHTPLPLRLITARALRRSAPLAPPDGCACVRLSALAVCKRHPIDDPCRAPRNADGTLPGDLGGPPRPDGTPAADGDNAEEREEHATRKRARQEEIAEGLISAE